MVWINESDILGVALGSATDVTTGSIFLTMLLILLVLLVVALFFGIPLEYTGIIFIPLLLGYAAYYQEFLVVVLCLAVYFAVLIAKNWLFR